MKNLFIINRDEAAIYYRENMMAHFKDYQNDVAIQEFATDLKQLAEELSHMSSENLELARKCFSKLFAVGSTMMLLSDEDFPILEKMEDEKQDWKVCVFTSCGKPIGLFSRNEVTW